MTERYRSLREEMDSIAQIAIDSAAKTDRDIPYLHLFGDDGVTLAALAVGDGAHQAHTARCLVHLEDPQMAIFSTEGWTINPDLPSTDPDRRRVELGEIAPSDLPTAKRGEILWLYGETRDGENLERMWVIESKNGRRTGLRELPPFTEAHSRFKPLFLLEDFLRLIETGIMGSSPIPTDLLDLLREASKHMSADERRTRVKAAIGQMLAAGGGMTTAEWQKQRARSHRFAREQILRDGPANSQG